jgi:hypothetical protein
MGLLATAQRQRVLSSPDIEDKRHRSYAGYFQSSARPPDRMHRKFIVAFAPGTYGNVLSK